MFYSLKNRLMAFFILLLVLSFGTMSLLLFNEARALVRSYIESSALEKMDQYGSFVQMALTQIYDLSSFVFNSEMTKEWDRTLSDAQRGSGDKMLANLALSQFLTQATNNYSGVSSVTIYRRDGLWIGAENQVVSDPSFLSEPWYTGFLKHSERWVSAHTDQVEANYSRSYQVVSLLMPIGTFEPSKARNVMKVNVSSDFLLEPLNRIHLGESGNIYLLDQEGRPVLPQDGFDRYPEAADKLKKVIASSTKQGVEYVQNHRGQTDILVYKKLTKNNWLLAGFVSEEDLYANLSRLRSSMTILATVLLVAAIVLATWLAYSITKPLSRLVSAMRQVQKGEFANAEQLIPEQRVIRHEVDYATSTFRQMVQQLRSHIQTEFELKLLRQQAEYKALLLQINPHFLFNTLELLSSLAIQGKTKPTVRIIEALGKMLRFSLRISEDLIPLREELTYIRHYVSILQIRFGERLDLTIQEEGELEQLEIAKFILQPLIENAVKYGFAEQMEAKVVITIRREGGRLRLIVTDNGSGMSAQRLAELTENKGAIEMDQILRSKSKQIGLRNVLARCQLYYGSLFEYTIQSRDSGPERGTMIELIVPVQRRTQDVPRIDRG